MILGEETLNDRINIKEHIGEVLVFRNLPYDLIQEDSYGVPNSEWNEPIELYLNRKNKYENIRNKTLLNKYSHLPFIRDHNSLIPALGYYCNGKEWLKIPKYKPCTFAPGYSWEEENYPKKFQCPKTGGWFFLFKSY